MESLPIHPKQKKVLIYSKDYCPYCSAAKKLLTQIGAGYEEIDLQKSPDKKEEMMAKSEGRKTVPQVFIDDVGYGGFDDINELHQNQQLVPKIFPEGK